MMNFLQVPRTVGKLVYRILKISIMKPLHRTNYSSTYFSPASLSPASNVESSNDCELLH